MASHQRLDKEVTNSKTSSRALPITILALVGTILIFYALALNMPIFSIYAPADPIYMLLIVTLYISPVSGTALVFPSIERPPSGGWYPFLIRD